LATQTNGAVQSALDAGIVRVIEAFDEIVRPEGGSVSFVALDGGKLRVAYVAGVNEDCPTCVMEPDALGHMMHDMLRDQAPEIEEVVVHVAIPAAGGAT
jgi:Fe-S cluster biogenesis protein NfuA